MMSASYGRRIITIGGACEYLNPQGVPCREGATHEVREGVLRIGSYCRLHAEMVERDGCDGLAASSPFGGAKSGGGE